jgi:glycosyltransferase involved in cell wall biosynthesis
MRVALFSGNYNYVREGANQALNRLVHFVEGDGHRVRVYSPVTDTPAFEPEGTLVPVPSVALPVRGEFRLALGLPAQTREDIRRFAPDLFHVSTPDILGTRAQSFAKHLGVPVVASLHTRFETYLQYYRLGWARPLIEAQLRRFYGRSDHVLAPTPGTVEEMRRLRGDDRVSLWSRGVDRDLFDPRRRSREWRRTRGLSDDEVVVLFFGRLVLEKGVEDFVAIVQRLIEGGFPVRPLIVGDGPARNAFSALPGAVFAGHLDGPELATAIASADILLHPSRTETFGNVVLEAMASGLAVVCATADSSRTLVDPGRSGILCSPDARDEFVAAIAELAGNVGRRTELGRAARLASSCFSWDDASRSVVRAYAGAMAGTRGAWL